MAIQEKLYTADDLFELAERPENGEKFFELIDGVLYEMPPVMAKPTTIAARIVRHLGNFVEDQALGYVSGADGGYELSPRTVLAPDVGFMSKERQPEMPERYFIGAPDLAVEVVSASDTIKGVQRKALKYLQYGTKLVWIFYPDEETVDVCRLAEGGGMVIHEVGKDGVLDGEDALPGFTLALKDIYVS